MLKIYKILIRLKLIIIITFLIAIIVITTISSKNIIRHRRSKIVDEIMGRAYICSFEGEKDKNVTDEIIIKMTDMAINALGDDMYDHRPFLLKADVLASRGEEKKAIIYYVKAKEHLNKTKTDCMHLESYGLKSTISRERSARRILEISINIKLKYLSSGKRWKCESEITSLVRQEIKKMGKQ